MDIATIITMVASQGLPIVACGFILFGLYKGIPKLCTYVGSKIDIFLESQLDKDKEIVKSVKEISRTNTQLAKSLAEQGIRLSKVEEDVRDIKDVILR